MFFVRCFDDVQEAYRGMASALSEADGIDYTDPEEVSVWECINIFGLCYTVLVDSIVLVSMLIYLTILSCLEQLELLVATLIDLDAMDGKSTVSLLAECSSSPDVNTRWAFYLWI